MAGRFRFIAAMTLFLLIGTASAASSPASSFEKSAFKVVSDLKESVARSMGVKAEELTIVDYDIEDAVMGYSTVYQFDLEMDNQVSFPFKVFDDVHRWRSIDSSIFRKEKKGFVEPVLAPFDLVGPMELWIQDGQDMRISLPHDVDAGVVNKVILSQGAAVTVQGARAVVLQQPIDLPTSNTTLAALSDNLRHASMQQKPVVSIHIVGPSSITSASSSVTHSLSSSSTSNRLKVRRVAPGYLELSSRANSSSPSALARLEESSKSSPSPAPVASPGFWPVASLSPSHPNLVIFETILKNSVVAFKLANNATEEPSLRLRKAELSTRTLMKIGFGVERSLNGSEPGLEKIPAWRTKPSTMTLHFEVLARVERSEEKVKLVAESVQQVKPVIVEDSYSHKALFGNRTAASNGPSVMLPPSVFTL